MGGYATANTSFGIAARRAGLLCCEPEQIPKLLTDLRMMKTDVDKDGLLDIDELVSLSDPNAKDTELACTWAKREGGCQVGFGAARASGTWLLIALLVFIRLFRRAVPFT